MVGLGLQAPGRGMREAVRRFQVSALMAGVEGGVGCGCILVGVMCNSNS